MGPEGVSAAIVAGGQAQRFGGRDKSRLVVQGVSIINRQLLVLQQVASEIFVVSSDTDRFLDLGLRVHADAIAGAGALGGIYTALAMAASDTVVTVACDLPFLEARLLRRLIELSADADAAWVQTHRGPEPLLACYRRSARDPIRSEIEAGRLKASNLGAVIRIAALDESELPQFGPPHQLLANLNTEEEWNRHRG